LIALNGEHAKNIQLNLDFLAYGTSKSNLLQVEPGQPSELDDRTENFTRNSAMRLKLSSGGGLVGKFHI